MGNKQIVVSRADAGRLRALLANRVNAALDQEHLEELRMELERAQVLERDNMPADVVSMGSSVTIRDASTGDRRRIVLVYPAEADVRENRISVLAPLGTALLGHRAGDEVEWVMPGGLRKLSIERVLPEAAHVPSAALARESQASAASAADH
jgi:regulator of nucleoside diphosphate kinase